MIAWPNMWLFTVIKSKIGKGTYSCYLTEISLPSEMRYGFWANVFAGTDYGISMLTSYIYSIAGSDNQSNKNLGDGIWHG